MDTNKAGSTQVQVQAVRRPSAAAPLDLRTPSGKQLRF
jgi:hypothetical protein